MGTNEIVIGVLVLVGLVGFLFVRRKKKKKDDNDDDSGGGTPSPVNPNPPVGYDEIR